MNKQTRLQNLAQSLQQNDLDWIALVPNTSLVYLTGIHSHVSERPIVVFLGADGTQAAIMPVLEAMKAEQAGIAADHIFAWGDSDGYVGAFEQAVKTLGLAGKKIGVEARYMRVLESDLLQEMAAGSQLVHADNVTNGLRLRKEAAEISAMQTAVDVAEAALKTYLPQIKIGMSEKAIASGLIQSLNQAGSDGLAFNPIVSAGANGASPHATPTDRPIQDGDLLILDWGAKVGEYVSDITRTFAVGQVDAKAQAMYAAVLAANRAGFAVCQPDVTCHTIDQAARQAIVDAGLGDYFIHRTGHGLGMEAHEAPSVATGNHLPLPVGAAFTIEPGVYVPNKGGVRIEDDIVITADGAISLTSLPRELTTIG